MKPHPSLPRSDRSAPHVDHFGFGGRATAAFVRGDSLSHVVRHVIEGRSVEIVGPRSSGRTELLRRVQLDLSLHDRIAVAIRGVDGAAPLEAARLGLPAAERSTLLPRGLTTPTLHHAYEAYLGVRPAVVLVDDVDRLDQASWALLLGLHATLGAPLVTVTRPYPAWAIPRQSVIRSGQPATRVELLPLSLDETRTILENRLGGTVAPDVVSRIHTKSAGQPGIALALLDAAREARHLRQEQGQWSASSGLWASGANATFEAMLVGLAPGSQDALEMLSIAGVTDLETAQSLVGVEALETLDGHRMIRIIATAEQTRVAVNPPGIAEYFLHLEPSARRHRLVEEVTAVLSDRHADDELDYVDVVWRHAERSTAVLPLRTPMELPHIVRMFTEDHQSRRRVALRMWQAERTLETANACLISELTGTPDPATLDELIAHALDSEGAPEDELLVRYLRSRAVLALSGDGQAAVSALTDRIRPDFPFADALRALEYATHLEFAGAVPETAAVLRQRVGRDLNGQIARVVLGLHLVLSGEGSEALPLLANSWEEMPALLATFAEVLYGLALALSGQQRRAAEWASARLERAITDIDRSALAGHAYVAAIALTTHSRFDEANDVASLPLRIGISTLHFPSSPDEASLMLMSVLAGYAGHASSADALAKAASRLRARGKGLPFADADWRLASSQYLEADRAGARRTLEAIAARADARGYRAAADHALFVAHSVSFDSATVAGVHARVEQTGGELALAYLRAREALSAGDGHTTMEAASRLAELDAPHAAAKYYAQAASLFRETGRLDEAAEARAAIQALGDNGAGTGTSRADDPAPRTLTARETQVVRFIADGLSNGQIAERLVLSVRTVESHINRITRKTGVMGRDEIARLARP